MSFIYPGEIVNNSREYATSVCYQLSQEDNYFIILSTSLRGLARHSDSCWAILLLTLSDSSLMFSGSMFSVSMGSSTLSLICLACPNFQLFLGNVFWVSSITNGKIGTSLLIASAKAP